MHRIDRLVRQSACVAALLTLLHCDSKSERVEAAPLTPTATQAPAQPAAATPTAKEPLRIWWAQWAPADSLQTLAKQYTDKTGVPVSVHQIPWPKFQDQVFQEFGKQETSFDIVVGDSQWLGRGATKKLYVELTDWLPKAVDIKSLHPLALKYLAEYPTGSGKYWSAPCETDAVGFAYRKDWFSDPAEQAAFKKKYNRELAAPTTWDELKQVAEFFHRPDKKKYGVALLTGRGYDEVVMGFEQVLYAFGGSWGNFETRQVTGHLDSPEAVRALDFFKSLVDLSPPGGSKLSFGEVLEPLQNGTVAMAMNYFAFLPTLSKEMGDKVGFFVMPKQGERRAASLGGQGMAISTKTSPAQQESAKQFIAWFLEQAQQEKWIQLPGGFTANAAILKSDAFKKATPYNQAFSESMDVLQDFWNVPVYNELLASVVQHVGETLDGSKSSSESLKALAKEQGEILKQVTD